MRVVDTSAWIECLKGSKFGRVMANELPMPADWLVPTIVQLELVRRASREAGEEKADEIVGFTMTECVVVPLDTPIAIAAAELGARYKLATADAIIYGTALAHNADLLTCDRHFENLPSVRYFPKPTA